MDSGNFEFEKKPSPCFGDLTRFLSSPANEFKFDEEETKSWLSNLSSNLSELSSKHRNLFAQITKEQINPGGTGTAFINYPNFKAKCLNAEQLDESIHQLANFDLVYFPKDGARKDEILCFRNLMVRPLVNFAKENAIAPEKIFEHLDFSDL